MVGGVECVTVEGAARILESLAFADTPDIDSTSARHREVAEIMIDHADIVVFVSSASRYGDLVPWEIIRRARSPWRALAHGAESGELGLGFGPR